MPPPTPIPTPTLHTARLRLRPFVQHDADALYALQSNPRVMRYWDAPAWTDRARAAAFLTACQQMQDEGSGARFAIETHADKAFIGWCSLFRWNPVYRSLGIGYCLDEPAWGRGHATEAVRAMLQWAFGALDLNRVEAELDTRNTASARVLDKLGFRREGLRREDCIVSGEVSDSWIYGLLRSDWQALPTATGDAAALPGSDPDARASRSLSLVSLVVHRYDEALAFYRDRLGFDLVEDTPLAAGKRWVVVRPRGTGSASVLLAQASTPEQASAVGSQTGGRVFLFLNTDDLDRDHRLYRANGVEFVREPADMPYGRVAVFKDLYGNLWDLVQPLPAGDPLRTP
jgi:RimJ/RimL family protein N-acetyltransferase/catechol 2,3-dioxygenase-like lactoylglutathione lyase family enzyme